MATAPDPGIRDLGQTRLSLRRDLRCVPRIERGRPYYVLEDGIHSKYYRIGVREYAFLLALDGERTVQEAICEAARAMPHGAVSQQQATAICKWLVDHQLVHTRGSNATSAASDRKEKVKEKRRPGRWNILWMRIPLAHPHRLLTWLVPRVGWFFSPLFLAVRAVAVVAAGAYLWTHWHSLVASAMQIVAIEKWAWLTICWLGLKLLHELAHGIVCNRYGGTVREAGVLLILFAPLAYVDVSVAWRFRSKWQRIHVAAAGIAMELTLAAIATLVWAMTESGLTHDLALNVLVMASLTTIVVNANPLMRFDGYFILADLLEIPNLYGIAKQRLCNLASRLFLGVTMPIAEWRNHGWLLTLYGVATLAWRMMVMASLLVAAALLFPGAEVFVVTAGVWFFGLFPAWRFARYLAEGNAWGAPNRVRFLITSGALTAGILVTLFAVPWPMPVRAPALVEDRAPSIVRAGSDGFVRELAVHAGQPVVTGQVLAVLDNPSLRVELADRRLAIEQTKWRCRSYRRKGQMAAYQAEKKTLDALLQQTRQLQAEVDALVLRAPTSGRVVGRRLEATIGTYLRAGDSLLVISRVAEKDARISIAEEDLQAFSASVGRSIRLRIAGFGTLDGQLVRVLPRASRRPPHRSLIASAGGTLTVERRLVQRGEQDTPETVEALVDPRFSAVVRLSRRQSERLYSGQRGIAFVRAHHETIATHLSGQMRNWLEKQMARYQGGK
ncbi:MAG: HlyD family efflux transporter periplasmic adaptor subunit [Pirellulales bacterium]